MLSPGDRVPAVELLEPPPGYVLDRGVITTFTLDLEALLLVPMARIADGREDNAALLADPTRIIEGVRTLGDRVAIFCDAAHIGVPSRGRSLFAMLEPAVHPTRARHGGYFHPKIWVLRFKKGDHVIIRAALLSRNLTFDRSWDVLFASQGSPRGKRGRSDSKALAQLLRALPDMAESVTDAWRVAVGGLADEVHRTQFPPPPGFRGACVFHAIGIAGKRPKRWGPKAWPMPGGTRGMAVSPFVSSATMDQLSDFCWETPKIVSRDDQLRDALPDAEHEWDAFVLQEAAHDSDQPDTPFAGLHAKMVGVEYNREVTWFMGSANLTEQGWSGRNVEIMVQLQGGTGSKTGVGLARFWESFSGLTARFDLAADSEEDPPDEDVETAQKAQRRTRQVVADATLQVTCRALDDGYELAIEGELDVSREVEVSVWPLSLDRAQARPWEQAVFRPLGPEAITAFIGFELRSPKCPQAGVVRFVLKLPANGFPPDRERHVLRSVVRNRAGFFRYLQALLAGLDGFQLLDPPPDPGNGHDGNGHKQFSPSPTLLEDLLRAAARQPERLEPVRRLVSDLIGDDGQTQDERVVPQDFLQIWLAVEAAIDAPRKASR